MTFLQFPSAMLQGLMSCKRPPPQQLFPDSACSFEEDLLAGFIVPETAFSLKISSRLCRLSGVPCTQASGQPHHFKGEKLPTAALLKWNPKPGSLVCNNSYVGCCAEVLNIQLRFFFKNVFQAGDQQHCKNHAGVVGVQFETWFGKLCQSSIQSVLAICFPRSLATAAPRLKDVWVKDAQQNITRFTQLGVWKLNGFNMV